MEAIAQQFIRALRGRRSQRAFSKRLGYRSNPVALWETGRRYPTAAETLRLCKVVRINVAKALELFHRPSAGAFKHGDQGVANWLEALRGDTSITSLASRVGASRFAVSRWLSGATRPRLPDFLRLVEALTGRITDFVGALVPLDKLPDLYAQRAAEETARTLSRREPWTAAILLMLETDAYGKLRAHDDGWVATRLGVPSELVADVISALAAAKIVERQKNRYVAVRELHTYSRGAPVSLRKQHWARVAAERMPTARDGDYFTFVVGTLSREDFAFLRRRLRETLQRTLAEISASDSEMVALMNIHLVGWDPKEKHIV